MTAFSKSERSSASVPASSSEFSARTRGSDGQPPLPNLPPTPTVFMRYTAQQHLEMTRHLHERSEKEPDPEKAAKQAAMANVFRLLAAEAARQKINSPQRATPMIGEPGPSADLPVAQQKRLTGLIDPPSPFDTVETWETHLKFLRALPGFRFVAGAYQEAEDVIAEMRPQVAAIRQG